MFTPLVLLLAACVTLVSAKTVTYDFKIGWVTVSLDELHEYERT